MAFRITSLVTEFEVGRTLHNENIIDSAVLEKEIDEWDPKLPLRTKRLRTFHLNLTSKDVCSDSGVD